MLEMKVKILQQDTSEYCVDFSKRIDEFIKDKEIIDIKYSSSVATYGNIRNGYETQLIHSVMIMYKEK